MILQSTFIQILEAQRENLTLRPTGLERDTLKKLPDLSSHALIISGIRRCGKSTLLYQLLKAKYRNALYLNFEDPRLYEFSPNDFIRLDEAISESKSLVLLFDEIQIVPEWEKYVRGKLDEGFKIVITGSNASLLSRELGTKLTGRHITKELFPFSFKEFNLFSRSKPSEASLLKYLETGGFPEYVKSGADEILTHLFEDILIRDIAVRYGIRDVKSLQRVAFYLVSNAGSLITGNRLRSMFEIGSTSTVMEYLSFLEASYLFQFVPKFSYSLRKQLINPRKVYVLDTGLISVISGSFSEDKGHKFENLVYLHLRRTYKDIYYFAEKGECDFIVSEKGKTNLAIQACFDLNQDNLNREMNGLIEAMELFKLKKGIIVTLNQKDSFKKKDMEVDVVPFYEWVGDRDET